MIILNIFLITLAIARDPDPSGPGPGRPPRCEPARVEQCKLEHRSELERLQSRISDYSEKNASLSHASLQLEESQNDFAKKIQLLQENTRLATKERKFLEQELAGAEKKREFVTPISLQKIFLLRAEEIFWLENFPAERLTRLNTRADRLVEETLLLEKTQSEIRKRIQSLGAEMSANSTMITALELDKKPHARMYETGCDEAYCRTD